VVYASALVSPTGKEHLANCLVQGLACLVPDKIKPGGQLTVQLDHGPLGQPLLLLDGKPGPTISFSQAGGRIWSALAGAGRVGIDVALSTEFPPDYPLHRAFSPPELALVSTLYRGDVSQTAALLWSLKEAVVKALGVGFNYLDPRKIDTGPGLPWQGGLLFEVEAGCRVKTWARPEAGGWLAIALHK
jgi:phosphopantetheinyl transferase